MGHARAILGLADADQQTKLANAAAAQGMSVRQVERDVQKLNERRNPTDEDDKPEEPKIDPNVKAATQALEAALGTRVRIIEKSTKRGRIEIDYFSPEDLQRIYELIIGEESD
jgi:ParB family chromosome partitioning protein